MDDLFELCDNSNDKKVPKEREKYYL